ncbi:MAG: addiction module protein [Oceanococcaceae bacterium]
MPYKLLGTQGHLRYALAMVDAALISKVKTLSPKDRLELIGAVWESLDQSHVLVSADERALLDSRLQDLDQNPLSQSPWPEVRARLRKLIT